MPREIKDIKQFLSLAGRGDAKACRIKKSVRKTERGTSVTVVKFKIRCSRYLYTLVVNDAEKADKLRGSLPPTLKIEDVDKPTGKKKK